jgi:hypothetical protein
LFYSLSVVPVLLITLALSFLSLNFTEHFKKNKIAILLISGMIVVNGLAWIIGLKANFTSNDIYLIFLLSLVILFSDLKSVEIARRPILLLLILNLFFYILETQIGLMSVYVDTFYDLYISLSHFLTSKAGLISNTQSIIRRYSDFVVFIRPSGFFSNLHLSSFGLFCFYAYLNLENKYKFLQYLIGYLILFGGTLQTILCLIIYIFLCSIKSFKKVGLVLFFFVLPFTFYVISIYGPQREHEYNNMYRIFTDSLTILRNVPIKALLWGDSIYKIIDHLGNSVAHPEMLIESGLLRYTVTIGLVNILFILGLFTRVYLKDPTEDKRPYFFLIATLGTYMHYFMNTTFVGSILVVFVFKSQQLQAGHQNSRVKDIKNKNENQRTPAILKWVTNSKFAKLIAES